MKHKYDIFISYRRAGGIDSAVALRSTLRQMHYRVFLDVDNLRMGHFDTELLQRIDECRDFLLVLSPGALDRCVNEDDWVRREIEHAMAAGKNIIPIICDGGSVQERLQQVPLPDSLADLTRYQVLEANVVQLRAMTQLLRTTLTARPHNPMKGVLIGAAAAVVLCMIGFFAAGWIRDYQNTYPRTAKEKNWVEQAIAQQVLNLGRYNAAQGDYLAALDSCELYLSGSPQMTRNSLSLQMEHALTTISDQKAALEDIDPALLASLADSPLPTADLKAQADYIRLILDEMAGDLLHLEYFLIDDSFTPGVSKMIWTDYMQDMAGLNAENVLLGINDAFLPVSDEALTSLRTQSLPELGFLYKRQPWYTSETEILTSADDIYKRQKALNEKLEDNIRDNNAMLEHERKLRELQQQVREEQLEKAKAALEEAKRKLAEEKERLYQVHQPTREDDPDLLFSKGVMFLSFNMLDAALESFTLYGMSSDFNAKAVAEAVSRFAMYQEETGIRNGLVITMYEPDKPEQPVQIGDIVYAINGQEVTYVDEYIAIKGGNAASTLYILRFTAAGYEKLTVQLDPAAGLLGFRSLAYQ